MTLNSRILAAFWLALAAGLVAHAAGMNTWNNVWPPDACDVGVLVFCATLMLTGRKSA